MYQYFVKIVPTVYKKLNGEVKDITWVFLMSDQELSTIIQLVGQDERKKEE